MDEQEHRAILTQEALAALIERLEPGAFLTEGLVVMEVIGADGKKAVWTTSTPEMLQHRTMGLLRYAEALEFSNVALGEE